MLIFQQINALHIEFFVELFLRREWQAVRFTYEGGGGGSKSKITNIYISWNQYKSKFVTLYSVPYG